MELAGAKGSSIISLRISTLRRKSCPGKMGQVWDGKVPDLGWPKEGALQSQVRNGDSGGDKGVSQPGVGREVVWAGDVRAPSAARCDSHVLGCSGDAEPHAALRSTGPWGGPRWDPCAKPRAAASPRVPTRQLQRRGQDTSRLLRSPALAHTRSRTFQITQPALLQHPAPAPGARFTGCSASPGTPVVRLSAARQLRRSAPMQILQICASSAASARSAWPAARRRLERAPSCTAGCRQHPAPGLGGAALYLPRTGERCNIQWPRCMRLHQHPGKASWCWAGLAQRGAHAALCPTAQASPEGRILLPQGSPQHRCFPGRTGRVH